MTIRLSARNVAQDPRLRLFGMVVYLAIIAVLLYGGIRLIKQLLEHPANRCPDTSHLLPDPLMIIFGIVALIAGRYLGSLRYRQEWAEPNSGQGQWSKTWWSNVVGKVAFLGFLLLCTVALVYEGIGEKESHLSITPPFPGLAPITEYSRCAVYYDKTGWSHGAITYGVVIALCALVGHWLWSYHVPEHFHPPTPSSDAEAVSLEV